MNHHLPEIDFNNPEIDFNNPALPALKWLVGKSEFVGVDELTHEKTFMFHGDIPVRLKYDLEYLVKSENWTCERGAVFSSYHKNFGCTSVILGLPVRIDDSRVMLTIIV